MKKITKVILLLSLFVISNSFAQNSNSIKSINKKGTSSIKKVSTYVNTHSYQKVQEIDQSSTVSSQANDVEYEYEYENEIQVPVKKTSTALKNTEIQTEFEFEYEYEEVVDNSHIENVSEQTNEEYDYVVSVPSVQPYNSSSDLEVEYEYE